MARGLEEWLKPRRDGRPLQLGVLGGTFDPIHIGHLVAAEAARVHFRLDRVLFVPAGRPPHKDPAGVSDAEHRYRMTVLATAGNPHFYTTRLELDREGPSYTIDTLTQLSTMAGPGASLYFIAGADSVVTLPSWRGGLGLLDVCHLIVVTRPGLPGAVLQRFLDGLPAARRGRVHVLPIPEIGISSTELRERVAAGQSIRYLVPAAGRITWKSMGFTAPRRRSPRPGLRPPETGRSAGRRGRPPKAGSRRPRGWGRGAMRGSKAGRGTRPADPKEERCQGMAARRWEPGRAAGFVRRRPVSPEGDSTCRDRCRKGRERCRKPCPCKPCPWKRRCAAPS